MTTERDLSLLREIFLEAVGPVGPVAIEEAGDGKKDNQGVDTASGAPRLSPEQLAFLKLAETPGVKLDGLIASAESMPPVHLLECAAVCGEILNHANMTDAHAKLTTWKLCQRADAGAHEGSSLPTFQAAYDKMTKEAGVAPEAVRSALATQKVDLVLTAHPTEAQRRTILLKQKRTVNLLEEYQRLSEGNGTPGELEQMAGMIKRELLSAWRTSSVRRSKPTAEGEARNGMAVIEETLWKAVPDHYRRIDRLLERNGLSALPHDAAPLQISSWMGGDRDGNPNVTSAVTRRVVTLLRSRAAEFYYKEVDALLFELTHTGPITHEMRASSRRASPTPPTTRRRAPPAPRRSSPPTRASASRRRSRRACPTTSRTASC